MATLINCIDLLTSAKLRLKRISDSVQTDWNDPAGKEFEKITQQFEYPLDQTISELKNIHKLIINLHKDLE